MLTFQWVEKLFELWDYLKWAGINRIALITGLKHRRYPDAGMSMVSSDHFVNFILSFPCLLWKNIQNESITATMKQKVLFLYVKRVFPAQKIEIKLIFGTLGLLSCVCVTTSLKKTHCILFPLYLPETIVNNDHSSSA